MNTNLNKLLKIELDLVKTLVSIVNKKGLQNEQFYLDFLDELNEISIS